MSVGWCGIFDSGKTARMFGGFWASGVSAGAGCNHDRRHKICGQLRLVDRALVARVYF